jgi:hypothetical protein
MTGRLRIHSLILLLLIITAAIGLASKLYAGPAADWINNSLSGVIYEIFWCLAALLLFPRARAWKIAAWVFVITCFLEALQLWHEMHLEQIRATFIGRALLGTSFTWLDFPYYAVGCGVGWLLVRSLQSYFKRTAVP